MREVVPGDLIFSFVDTRIIAIGTVASYCYESPKPAEFGEVGLNWEAIGWRVRVNFTSLVHRIQPKDHIDTLRGLLPARYSPLQESGNGIQSIYLTEVQTPLAETLVGLIGAEAMILVGRSAALNPEESVQSHRCSVRRANGLVQTSQGLVITTHMSGAGPFVPPRPCQRSFQTGRGWCR